MSKKGCDDRLTKERTLEWLQWRGEEMDVKLKKDKEKKMSCKRQKTSTN